MLQGMTWASPPALRMPAATSSQASALRLEITTLAPSLASSSAEERPMPRLEPVMTATVPVRSNGVFFILLSPSVLILFVMAGLVPAIHALPLRPTFPCGQPSLAAKTWMPGTKAGHDDHFVVSSLGLHQPARLGDAAEVVLGVAEGVLDHGEALEIVADLGFHGHADAAMKLDRLLADEFQRLADLHLRRGNSGRALLGVVEIGRHGRKHRHAAGLLDRDEHVGGAVLQGLEAADRHAELLSRFQIFDGGFQRFIHGADGLRAHRGAGF